MNATLRRTLSPARHPCGGLRVRIAGEACVLRTSGALWVIGHNTLIAADLHLEKGSAYAARGQMLPPYDSAATLQRLEAEIAALDPARVVLLGDSFHDARAIGRMALDDRARLDRPRPRRAPTLFRDGRGEGHPACLRGLHRRAECARSGDFRVVP